MLFFWRTLVVIVNEHFVHSCNLGNKESCCFLILSLIRQNVWGWWWVFLRFMFDILEQSVVWKIQSTEVTRWKVNPEPFTVHLLICVESVPRVWNISFQHRMTFRCFKFVASFDRKLKRFLLFTHSQRKTKNKCKKNRVHV